MHLIPGLGGRKASSATARGSGFILRDLLHHSDDSISLQMRFSSAFFFSSPSRLPPPASIFFLFLTRRLVWLPFAAFPAVLGFRMFSVLSCCCCCYGEELLYEIVLFFFSTKAKNIIKGAAGPPWEKYPGNLLIHAFSNPLHISILMLPQRQRPEKTQ